MTIASTLAKAGPYSCDGAQTEFPFAFRVLDPSCVTVYLDDVQVTDGFTAELAETGGTVKFAEAPAKGSVLAILRETPFDQQTDLQDNQAFLPEVLETSLDKLTMQTQELLEQLKRAITMPPTSTISPREWLEAFKKTLEASKDAALDASVASANSAASASSCLSIITTIMTELTGDPSWAEESKNILQEIWEAKGAVEAAREVAIGDISNKADVAKAAVTEAAKQAQESAEASIDNKLVDAETEINAKVSAALGADAVFDAALKEANKNLNEDVQAALEAAESVASGYVQQAKDAVDSAIADWEAIRDEALAKGDQALVDLANAKLEALNDISAKVSEAQASSDNAFGYSNSALQSAQSAANEAAKAEAARIAAEAANSNIGNVVNTSLTAHDLSPSAHEGMFVKRVGDSGITGNLTLTGEGKGGLFASSVTSGSIDTKMLFSTNGAVESRVTDGSGDPYYRWFNGTAATDIRMVADGTLCTWNNFAKKHVAFKAKSLELEGESPEEATLRLTATNIAWSELFLNSENHLCIRTPGSPSINGILHAGELVLEGVGAVGATLTSMSAGRTSYPNYAAGLDVKSAYNDNAKSYTFPSDGWVLAYPASSGKMYINGGSVPVVKSSDASQECVFIPVRAGDTISGSTANFMAFFPNR